jgi:hypothetical protein
MKKNRKREFLLYFPSVLIVGFLFSISLSKVNIDNQGFLSLAFIIASITAYLFVTRKSPKEFVSTLKKVKISYGLPLLFLAGIIFVGFWLTARLIGFYFYKYLFKDGFYYTQYQIFEMISYILATRLCLTLFETIKKDALEEGHNNRFIKSGYIDTAIQAVIIGIITVLPNYANSSILERLGSTQDSQFLGFLALLITLVLILMLLLYSKKKLIIPDNFSSN